MTHKEQMTLDANAAALAVMDSKIDALIERVDPAVNFYLSLTGFGRNLARFGRELARFVKWGAGLGASLGGIYIALHIAGKV